MKKTCVLLFSIPTIVLTVYSAIRPTYLFQQLFDLSERLITARLLVAGVLLTYLFWSEVRTLAMRQLMFIMGGWLVAGSIAAFISPTMFGYFAGYIPIGDVFIFLEGGILALLLAAELPIHASHLSASLFKSHTLAHLTTKSPKTT